MKIKTYLCTLEDKVGVGHERLYINILANKGNDATAFLKQHYPDYDLVNMLECVADIVEYVDGTIEPYEPKE